MKRLYLVLMAIFLLAFPQTTFSGEGAKNVELIRSKVKSANYAIIIGVANYLNDEISKLNYCEKDADDFANVLINDCGYEKTHIIKLCGKDANRGKILNVLNSLKDRKLYQNPDTVIFYFSGHGTAFKGKNYILPFDGSIDMKELSRNISIDEVKGKLETSGFKRRIAFMDACRAPSDAKGPVDWGHGFVKSKYEFANGTKFLLGCEFGKIAWENDKSQNGLFTAYLLDGLKGAAKEDDNVITFSSLEKYVATQMNFYSKNSPAKQQIPVSMGEGSSLIPLAVATIKPDSGGQTSTVISSTETVADAHLIRTLTGHTDSVNSVAFSPNGTLMASGSSDSRVKLWNTSTWEEIPSLMGHSKAVNKVEFNADNAKLVSSCSDTVTIWAVQLKNEIRTFSPYYSLFALSPDITKIALTKFQDIHLISVLSGEELLEFTYPKPYQRVSYGLRNLTFSHDGSMLATLTYIDSPKGSYGDGIVILSALSGETICSNKFNFMQDSGSLAFSPDDSKLATGNYDGTITLWSTSTCSGIAVLHGHTDRVNSVAFSPDGSKLASGSKDRTINLWSMANGSEIATYKGHSDSVNSVSFSPDGKILASGSTDKTIKLWRID